MKQSMIDPLTGLELTEIKSAPSMRADSQPMMDPSPPSAPPMQTMEPPPMAMGDSRNVGGGKNRPAGKVSVLDGVIFALLGKPDQMKDQGELNRDAGKRQNAGNLAADAANGDPGSQFMGAPSGGGQSMTSLISTIARVIGGGLG